MIFFFLQQRASETQRWPNAAKALMKPMTNNCSVLAADEHLLSISGFVVCGSAGAAQVSTDNVKSSGATGLLFEDRKKEIRADFLFASCAIQDI